jgi:hypothetical protein
LLQLQLLQLTIQKALRPCLCLTAGCQVTKVASKSFAAKSRFTENDYSSANWVETE